MGFPYLDLVEKALKLSPEIRFATVCNMFGEVMYSEHREGVKNDLIHCRIGVNNSTQRFNILVLTEINE